MTGSHPPKYAKASSRYEDYRNFRRQEEVMAMIYKDVGSPFRHMVLMVITIIELEDQPPTKEEVEH